ncbi:MAG: L-2-amino-thiazoline-4-carboxylic acid hydrolase [Candidatus Kariarchaeaceae archaeon]
MTETENYYLKKQAKIMKRFHNTINNHLVEIIESDFDTSQIESIKDEIDIEFQTILPEIPYIGGKQNYWTSTLISVSIGLAISKVLQTKGLPDERIGEIVFQLQESAIDKRSWISRKLLKMMFVGFIGRWYMRRLAKKSQQSPYKYDVVFDYVEGDGKDLLFGFDFTKCGLVDFYNDHRAEQFAPFICLCDYAVAQKLGVGFKRTKTLAMGGEGCDHRYYKNQEFTNGWEPEKFGDYRAWKELQVIE